MAEFEEVKIVKMPSAPAVIDLLNDGKIVVGGNGVGGVLRIYRADKAPAANPLPYTAQLASNGFFTLGGNGASGKMVLYPKGSLGFGGGWTMMLDADKGDITLQNADCAEEFDISSTELTRIEPGTVMVIDSNRRLQISFKSYDKRVAGIVSGGGDRRPGIVLDKKSVSHNNSRVPIALVGKVNCKVDADYSTIKVGDMLTTSDTPGYAMKVTSYKKAFGAVLGKALQTAKSGKGLIPVLVALQ